MDSNRVHLVHNVAGVALSAIAFACAVVVSATGDDPLAVPHAVLIVYTALVGAWFTCGLLKATKTYVRKNGLA